MTTNHYDHDDYTAAARVQHERVLDNAIRRAYDMLLILGDEDGIERRWVGMVELRAELDADRRAAGVEPYDRSEVDAALRRLSREPGVHVQEEANRQALTDADHDAAVRFGGSSRHILLIEEPDHTDSGMDGGTGGVDSGGTDTAEAGADDADEEADRAHNQVHRELLEGDGVAEPGWAADADVTASGDRAAAAAERAATAVASTEIDALSNHLDHRPAAAHGDHTGHAPTFDDQDLYQHDKRYDAMEAL
ncbi:hypothetical protein JOF29_005702 [Kribbella aluminosa]|uniref:DUF222 domain-containing protein n=1 Tax=Kribbella aluminosa TaxID=416017 RepID=A0ABS4USH2_9ACTN|nr:hypothetical protein [Kribbella aluminosa]MBP2354592.1 hypothetical protein [Kribbella aluminosa]